MLALFSIIEFFLAVLLLPVVLAVTVTFIAGIKGLDSLAHYFMWGMYGYVIIHLFLQPLESVHRFIQKIFSESLKISPVLSNNLPLAVPLMPTLLLLLLYVLHSFFKLDELAKYFIVALGFFLSMHVVMTAKDLYSDDTSFLKANYLFVMSLVYIVAAVLIVLLLDLNFSKIAFMDFIRTAADTAFSIYKEAGHRLVLPAK